MGSFASERGLEGKPYYRCLLADPLSDIALPDSEAALLLKGYLMQWNATPWMGTAKWCMFDPGEVNATYTRNIWQLPFPDGRVTFRWPFSDYLGVSDLWRRPKEGFYFLQSQWADKPMVHIATGRVPQRHSAAAACVCTAIAIRWNCFSTARVWAWSGRRRPRAYGNDFHEAVARYRVPDQFNQRPLPGASLRHPPFIWDNVPCENGTLAAVGRKGDATVRYTLRTPGSPVRLQLKAEKQSLTADDEDVTFIEADVVDAQRVVVPEARPWIHFSVEGPGRLLGGAVDLDGISGVGAINVQSTGRPGEIIVKTNSPELESGVAKITAGR